MGGRRIGAAALLAGAVVAVVLVSAGSAAPSGYRERAAALRGQVSALEGRARAAVLELYALDARLHAVQARLASLHAEAARLRDEQRELARQLAATRRTLATSQRRLGAHLRALYEQGDTDPLAVMLGAKSLDDAMTELDDLTRVADQNREVADVAAAARVRVHRLASGLTARRARLRRSVDAAGRAASELVSARAERVGFVVRLRAEQQLETQQIRSLETAAQRVERKAASVQVAAAPAAPAAPDSPAAPSAAPPAAGVRTMTVVATGYSLSGQTATGAPVGWGVVAVDPGVIPLGTRLTIPGYGEGVAADTGVGGASIDLWFPTPAQAHAWGRRTVTIALH